METEAIVKQEKGSRFVVFSPTAVPQAQAGLVAWFDAKLADLRSHRKELADNLQIAKRGKWRWRPIASAVSRQNKLIEYYGRLKAAVEAGYIIIPDFPIQAFAIRVHKDELPGGRTSEYYTPLEQQPTLNLEKGDAVYVDPMPTRWASEWKEKDSSGKDITKTEWIASKWKDVAFPVLAVKPEVCEATRQAMSQKLFDEMGLVGPRSTLDPIVCGRIRHPLYPHRGVNFFIAWWLDPETL